VEVHHVDEKRGNNDPDNLSPRCRRCHMSHHGNDAALDGRTARRFGPPTSRSTTPPSATGGTHPGSQPRTGP